MNTVAFRLLFPDPRDRARDNARVVALLSLSLSLRSALPSIDIKTPHDYNDPRTFRDCTFTITFIVTFITFTINP